MYVDLGSHLYRSPCGMCIPFQCASPSNTWLYCFVYMLVETAARTVVSISCGVGQMSLRKTGLPDLSEPSGSVVRSRSIRPARAEATTSGGEAGKLGRTSG